MTPHFFSVHTGGIKARAIQLTCTTPYPETGTVDMDLHSTVLCESCGKDDTTECALQAQVPGIQARRA